MTPLELVEVVSEYDEDLAEEIKRKTEEWHKLDISDLAMQGGARLPGMFVFGDSADYWWAQHNFLASYLEGSSITYHA